MRTVLGNPNSLVSTGVRAKRLGAALLSLVVAACSGAANPPPPAPVPVPALASTSPADGATGVALSARIFATFDQPMNPLAAAELTLKLGGTAVAGTVTTSSDGRVATFIPAAGLAASSVFTATVAASPTSLAGVALAAGRTWTFTTTAPGAPPDTTPPAVLALAPDSGATGVALGARVTASFSEALDPSTVGATTVTLKQGVTPVAGVVVLSAGNLVFFTPAAPLASATVYTATIDAGVKDLAGNALGASISWSFTTADTVRPAVTATTPADAATGVGATAAIAATFSKSIDPASITTATFTLKQASAAVAGTVVLGVGNVALFTPSVALASSTVYTATIGSGVKDLAGNTLAAATIWSFTTADTTPPSVVSTSPASGATGVASGAAITATFSEAVGAASVSAATFTLWRGNGQVAGVVTLAAGGVVATLVPSAALASGAVYTASLSGIVDLDGNALPVSTWSFTTLDTVPPSVSATTPASGATGVGPFALITATFSEPVDPASINAATFTLKQGGTSVGGSVSLGAGNVALFTPTSALASGTVYTAGISTGAKDLAGNAVATAASWSFTTADTVPPAVVSTSPASAATGVAANAVITATFSEALKAATVNVGSFTVSLAGSLVTGAVTLAGNVATFAPSAALASGSVYTATLSSGIQDLAGNAFAGATWSFTSADTVAPVVTATHPSRGGIGAALNTAVTATFSETIDATTVTGANFTVKLGSTSVAGAVSLVAGNVATFVPNTALAPNTVYTAALGTGVKDLAGNALAAAFTWSFTTVDTSAPTVASTSPAGGAITVARNVVVTATFSRAMNPTTLTAATFILQQQGAAAVTGVVGLNGGTVATFTPASPLASGVVYTATIGTGAKDLSGNALGAPVSWSFTTADTTPPTVASTSPASAATGVALNTAVTATFSKALDPNSINAASFTLKRAGTSVGGAATYAANTATFTPGAALAASTVYTASLTTAIKDVAGNALVVAYGWTFTTGAAPDTTPPTVLSTIPAANDMGVALNTAISATFSKALDTNSAIAAFTLKQAGSLVPGAVSYGPNPILLFTPSAALMSNTTYTASISTGAMDLAGNHLVSSLTWTFTTGTANDTTAPTVTATFPLANATGTAFDVSPAATFSKALDPSTVTALSFTITQASSTVAGSISYGPGTTATFKPTSPLANDKLYTATITTGVKDLAGNALASAFTWSFTTGASLGPAVVLLGAAGNYVTLAKTGISTVPASAITGDLGLSPAAASFVTGFSLVADATNVFSRSTQVTGKIYAANYAVPTPSNLTTAVSNMEAAYTDAKGRINPDHLELLSGNIGGQTLAAGLYKWTSTVTIPGDVIISGSANDVWIFQTTGDLSMDAAKNVTLAGGAQAKNIFWQVEGNSTIGAGAHFEGVILGKLDVTLVTGASMNGRIFSQTQVALQSATLVQPAP